MGVTLGFHRLLTHRSFQTYKPVRVRAGDRRLDGGAGSGHELGRRPPQAPRPHRPGGRPAHAPRPRQRLQGRGLGLWYAHMGWLFERSGTSEHERYARDLYEDRGMQLHPQDVRALGGARDRDPGGVRPRRSRAPGAARSRRRCGAAPVRIFLGHHVTWSINSVCHFFGTPPLRRRRSLDQRLLALAALDGRVLAPQPPHVPALGLPRPRELGDRPDRLGDPRRCGA